MAYIIYNNDGTVLVNIANGDVDSSTTSLDLIGKNVDNYGQYFNNDLVRLLTNFAAPIEPVSPQIGQLWFNTTAKKLNVFNGVGFNPTYGATVSGTSAASPSKGDLWFNENTGQLKVWDEYNYRLIGPSVNEQLGKFGISTTTSVIYADDDGWPKEVGTIYSYGVSMGVLNAEPKFDMSAVDSLTYLNTGTTSTIVQGLTIANDLNINGNLHIGGIQQVPSAQTLTAYYDITAWGDPDDLTPGLAAINIENGNIVICDFLPKLFTTATTVAYNDIAYPIGSEARVVCYFNNTPSVRRFRLIDDTIHPGNRIWSFADPLVVVYYHAAASTVTNIVAL
jgi:hypothetical protein